MHQRMKSNDNPISEHIGSTRTLKRGDFNSANKEISLDSVLIQKDDAASSVCSENKKLEESSKFDEDSVDIKSPKWAIDYVKNKFKDLKSQEKSSNQYIYTRSPTIFKS